MKRAVISVFSVVAFIIFGILSYVGGLVGITSSPPALRVASARAAESGKAKAVFKVGCYDQGKAALRGLNGVEKVETGFSGMHEIDTVYYDPSRITVREMESALKRAGTYVDTMKERE